MSLGTGDADGCAFGVSVFAFDALGAILQPLIGIGSKDIEHDTKSEFDVVKALAALAVAVQPGVRAWAHFATISRLDVGARPPLNASVARLIAVAPLPPLGGNTVDRTLVCVALALLAQRWARLASVQRRLRNDALASLGSRQT